MFGIYRYLLALMVAIAHLWTSLTNWTGWYAVFGFYVLSGYLMAMVLSRVYGFSVSGTARFLTNRALRIYPPYLCVLVLSIAVAWGLSDVARNLNPSLQLPTTAKGWFTNFAIFGLNGQGFRIVPPGWSLDVELTYYVAMALLLARHPALTIAWLAASVSFTIYLDVVDAPFLYRFRATPSACLPFSLGAVIFHLRGRFRFDTRRFVVPVALLFFGHAALALAVWGDQAGIRREGFYVSLLAACLMTWVLSGLSARRAPRWLARADRVLGDLSYPIFLCHWATACLVTWLFFGGVKPQGGLLFLASFVPINLIAWGVHRAAGAPLERLRGLVRAR